MLTTKGMGQTFGTWIEFRPASFLYPWHAVCASFGSVWAAYDGKGNGRNRVYFHHFADVSIFYDDPRKEWGGRRRTNRDWEDMGEEELQPYIALAVNMMEQAGNSYTVVYPEGRNDSAEYCGSFAEAFAIAENAIASRKNTLPADRCVTIHYPGETGHATRLRTKTDLKKFKEQTAKNGKEAVQ